MAELFGKPGGFRHHCLSDGEAYSRLAGETAAEQWNQHFSNCLWPACITKGYLNQTWHHNGSPWHSATAARKHVGAIRKFHFPQKKINK